MGAQVLALGVQCGEEGGGCGFGGGAEVPVEIAEGRGAGEERVGDAGAGELEEAFEELGG